MKINFLNAATNWVQWVLIPVLIGLLVGFDVISSEPLASRKQRFDAQNLYRHLGEIEPELNPVSAGFIISPWANGLDRVELLGLDRARIAYPVVTEGEVTAISIPASVDDGFNGRVDLLITIGMFGRILQASVIEDLHGQQGPGMLDVIESSWMGEFSGSGMRDIQKIAWQTADTEGEYDQFVGASITPRAVANRVYDVLVFFQSNRILLLQEAQRAI